MWCNLPYPKSLIIRGGPSNAQNIIVNLPFSLTWAKVSIPIPYYKCYGRSNQKTRQTTSCHILIPDRCFVFNMKSTVISLGGYVNMSRFREWCRSDPEHLLLPDPWHESLWNFSEELNHDGMYGQEDMGVWRAEWKLCRVKSENNDIHKLVRVTMQVMKLEVLAWTESDVQEPWDVYPFSPTPIESVFMYPASVQPALHSYMVWFWPVSKSKRMSRVKASQDQCGNWSVLVALQSYLIKSIEILHGSPPVN